MNIYGRKEKFFVVCIFVVALFIVCCSITVVYEYIPKS